MAQNLELSKNPIEIGDSLSKVSFLGEEREEPKWKKRRVLRVATSNVLPSGDILRSQISTLHSTTLPTSYQSFLMIILPDLQPQTVMPVPSSLTAESMTVMKSLMPTSRMTVI